MKTKLGILIPIAMVSLTLIAVPVTSASASTKSSATISRAQKDGLKACADYAAIFSMAGAFDAPPKSTDKTIQKAREQAALGALHRLIMKEQADLNIAIRADSKYKSWQGLTTKIEAFSTTGKAFIGEGGATSKIQSDCAALHAQTGK